MARPIEAARSSGQAVSEEFTSSERCSSTTIKIWKNSVAGERTCCGGVQLLTAGATDRDAGTAARCICCDDCVTRRERIGKRCKSRNRIGTVHDLCVTPHDRWVTINRPLHPTVPPTVTTKHDTHKERSTPTHVRRMECRARVLQLTERTSTPPAASG